MGLDACIRTWPWLLGFLAAGGVLYHDLWQKRCARWLVIIIRECSLRQGASYDTFTADESTLLPSILAALLVCSPTDFSEMYNLSPKPASTYVSRKDKE